MAEPVKVDSKIGLLALVSAIAVSIGVIYGLKTDLAVVQVQAQTVKQDIERLKQDTEASREKMNNAVQDLRISVIRIEAGSRRIEEKLDELIKSRKP